MTCVGVQPSPVLLWSLAGSRLALQCDHCQYLRYQPVHLWSTEEDDTVSIVGTYKCINALDELSHAFSVAMSQDGESIFCGLKGEVCENCFVCWRLMKIMARFGSLMLQGLEERVGHMRCRTRVELSPALLFTPPCLSWLPGAITKQLDSTVLMVSSYVSSQGKPGESLRFSLAT